MGPNGESPQAMIEEAGWSGPSWSADGSLLAFGSYGEWDGEVAAVAEADGPSIRFFRRAPLVGDHPVMAPDGRTVAYWHKSSVWLLNVKSGSVRRLQAEFEPSSFSPDGSKLAGTVGYGPAEAVAVDLRTGHVSLLAREASEPVYSPDGSEVAFIRWKNWRASAVDDGSRRSTSCGSPGSAPSPDPGSCGAVTSCSPGRAGIPPDSASRSSAPVSSKMATTIR